MRLCSTSGYPERVITTVLLPACFSEQDHASFSAGQTVTYKAPCFWIALKATWELQPGQNTAAFLLTGTARSVSSTPVLCNKSNTHKGWTCWVLSSLKKSVFKSQNKAMLLRVPFPLCLTAAAVSRNILAVSFRILLQLGIWVAATMGRQL